jgi:hypothetical protein
LISLDPACDQSMPREAARTPLHVCDIPAVGRSNTMIIARSLFIV